MVTKEILTEITEMMKAKNYMPRHKNGVLQFVNKVLREGIELKNEKIDAFVIDEDNDQVYGLDKIGNESRDQIKAMQSVLNVVNVETPEKMPVSKDVSTGEVTVSTKGVWELSAELIADHPGTIPILIAMQRTPKEAIKTRKGPRGAELSYVDTGYMTFCLNYAALMRWNFEILESEIDMIDEKMHISVLGCVTMTTTDGIEIQKSAWGSQVLKAGSEMGDMRKAAASDAMKKCASLYGIAQDIYSGVV